MPRLLNLEEFKLASANTELIAELAYRFPYFSLQLNTGEIFRGCLDKIEAKRIERNGDVGHSVTVTLKQPVHHRPVAVEALDIQYIEAMPTEPTV